MHLNKNYTQSCCGECRLPFENGDEMFSWENELVCADCFDALFSELDRYDRARLIGSRLKNYRCSEGAPVG